MIERPKRLNRKLTYKGTILDVYRDTMAFANGSVEEWDFVSHRLGAAAILPVFDDGRILLVRQFRPALERETIEIPAGARDSTTEDTKVTAIRELEEETGYCAGKVEFLFSLRTTVAFCDEHVDVYMATGLKKSSAQHLDQAESIDVEICTYEELFEGIRQGRIEDAKTVSAIMAYGALRS